MRVPLKHDAGRGNNRGGLRGGEEHRRNHQLPRRRREHILVQR